MIVACLASRKRAAATLRLRLFASASFTVRVNPASPSVANQPLEILPSLPEETATQEPGVRIVRSSVGRPRFPAPQENVSVPTPMTRSRCTWLVLGFRMSNELKSFENRITHGGASHLGLAIATGGDITSAETIGDGLGNGGLDGICGFDFTE